MADEKLELEDMEIVGPAPILVSRIELHQGASLLGQTTTMSASSGSKLEVMHFGVKATSKTGRIVLIPWSNLRVVELAATKKSPKVGKK